MVALGRIKEKMKQKEENNINFSLEKTTYLRKQQISQALNIDPSCWN